MKIEKQVCTPDQSKRLKDFGVLQCAFFKWTERWMPYQTENWILDWNVHGNQMSAFSVAELGSVLPNCISGMTVGSFEGDVTSRFYATIDEYHDYDLDNCTIPKGDITEQWFVVSETEAQCRADLLLNMLSLKLLSVEQVNKLFMEHIELPELFLKAEQKNKI